VLPPPRTDRLLGSVPDGILVLHFYDGSVGLAQCGSTANTPNQCVCPDLCKMSPPPPGKKKEISVLVSRVSSLIYWQQLE
jgi:hypothetical protein